MQNENMALLVYEFKVKNRAEHLWQRLCARAPYDCTDQTPVKPALVRTSRANDIACVPAWKVPITNIDHLLPIRVAGSSFRKELLGLHGEQSHRKPKNNL